MNKINKIIKFAGLALLLHGTGRLAESYDHRFQQAMFRTQIIEAATQGYTWREGAETQFQKYHLSLVKHDDMTIGAYLIDEKNNLVGMMRKGGYIGSNIAERAQKWGEDLIEEGREQLGNLGEKTKELYQDLKEETKNVIK